MSNLNKFLQSFSNNNNVDGNNINDNDENVFNNKDVNKQESDSLKNKSNDVLKLNVKLKLNNNNKNNKNSSNNVNIDDHERNRKLKELQNEQRKKQEELRKKKELDKKLEIEKLRNEEELSNEEDFSVLSMVSEGRPKEKEVEKEQIPAAVEVRTKKTEREIYLENRRIEARVKKELEEELKNEKENELKEKQMAKEKEKRRLERLYLESGTPEIFKQKWFNTYNKAIHSEKNTLINQKVKKGKFRFDEGGVIEILPDFPISGKSSKDLLNETWSI